MVKTFRSFLLSFTIVAILIFSAIRTTTVYADDGTGTDAQKTKTTHGEGQSEEAAPSSEDAVAEDAVANEHSLGEIMEQVPNNTTVTVLNSEGKALPLASQETADVIESAYDPIWCPEGKPPVPGAEGCTDSFSSFTELLTYLQANETNVAYQQAGTIYIQKDQYLGGESAINFNDYNFNEINKHNLTLQGGWNTADNTVNPADTAQFSVPITIGSGTNPWIGSLTLNNISISGVTNQTGLTLYTQNNIDLSNVEVTNSQTGADLNAGGNVTINNSKFNKNKQANALVRAGGKVDINNSTFNDAEGLGLQINSMGSVSLASVEANNNGLFGANIVALGDVTIINSFFSGNTSTNIVSCPGGGSGGDDDKDDDKKGDDDKDSSHDDDDKSKDNDRDRDAKYSSKSDDHDDEDSSKDHDDDDKDSSKDDDDDDDDGQTTCNTGSTSSGYGLQVVTSGSIALDTVAASDNNLFGAHLEGTDIAISNSSFNNNGSGPGNEPVGKGLEIIASANSTGAGTGSVSLFNVEANNNQLFGANIQATGSVAIGGLSFFSGNKSTNIVSCPGGGSGGDDDKDDDKKSDDDKDSSHDDDDKSKDNDRDRDAKYSSKSDDKDDDKDSSKNDDDDKDSSKDDDDDGQTTCNTGSTSSGYGLQVVTTGPISLNNVSASDNSLFGAHLDGTDIAISNSSFNNNGSGTGNEPVGKGLEIISTGFVSLFNVEANNNQLFGANIQATGDVIIGNSFFSGNKSTNIVSCPGGGSGGDDDKDDDKDDDDKNSSDNDDKNKDNDRDRDAKYSSKSDDKDDDKDSSKNDDDDDDDKQPPKDDDDDDDDTTSCNNTTNVSGYGLQVVTTQGIIALDGVTASNNGVNGAILNSPANITVTNSTFDGNGGTGLVITTPGQVSLNNVTATNNGLDGVDVNGVCTTTVQLIDGTYANNVEYGLNISNATLHQSGSPVFMNNGVGDIFQDPGTCMISTTVGGQGFTRKISSPKVAEYSTYYRISNNNLGFLGSFRAFNSSNLFASKTRPYKYTGGLMH